MNKIIMQQLGREELYSIYLMYFVNGIKFGYSKVKFKFLEKLQENQI